MLRRNVRYLIKFKDLLGTVQEIEGVVIGSYGTGWVINTGEYCMGVRRDSVITCERS